MDIIYVFTSAGITDGSVQNKVINQIRGLRQAGMSCRGLFFTTDNITASDNTDDFSFIRIPDVKQGYFRSLRQRNACHKAVLGYFTKEQPGFDLIYFRYDHAGRFLNRLSNMYRKRICFEHVTAETEEIRLYKKENPLRLNLSSFLGNLEFMWLPLLQETLWAKGIRRKAAFGICNSEDIARHETKIAGGDYLTFIGGDAVRVEDYRLRTSAPVLENEFRMVFLKGASTAADFNGLDRIFEGIRNYKGKFRLKAYIFGKNLVYEKNMVKKAGVEDQVIFGNYISKDDAETFMEDIHLGISAMGLHRKGIKGTTTIKAREYFARGIPFIYGHNDPDLSGSPEAMKYCMEFPANDEPVDFEKVMEWYIQLNSSNTYFSDMREFANNYLDYSIKMGRLAAFIKKHQAHA